MLMKKNLFIFFPAFLLFSPAILRAQTITFSQSHVNGQTATSQCTAYGTFKAQLLPGLCYQSMTIKGSYDTVGVTCNDPIVVAAYAKGLNTYTGVYLPCNGVMWHLCPRYGGEIWLNPPDSCNGANCPSPGYIIRPCIGNANWGGVATATCNAPTQVMEMIFQLGGGPTTTDTISGPQFICSGDTNIYSIDTVTGASNYVWIAPPGDSVITGQGTDSVVVVAGSTPGWMKVTATNVCGTKVLDSVWIDAKPTLIPTGAKISGPDSLCTGDTATYTIAALNGALTYTWTLPSGASIISGAGTDSMTMVSGSAGGELKVSASNGCNSADLDSTTLIHASVPNAPLGLNGDLTPCWGDTQTYSAFQSAGASSYNWTIPGASMIIAGQGSLTIVMLVGPISGPVSISAINTCGSSSPATLSIAIDTCWLGTESIHRENFSVWPNPVGQTMNISFAGLPESGFMAEITDLHGRKTGIWEFYSGKNFELDLRHLQSGIYVLKGKYSGRQFTWKIVKE